jgi:hypothetical protein
MAWSGGCGMGVLEVSDQGRMPAESLPRRSQGKSMC